MFDNIADALAHPTKYTINHKRFLLVELSDMMIFKSTEPDFLRLQDAGMLLVITHPERNPLLRQRLEMLRRWVSMGIYLQLTGQSLFGRFGAKAKTFSETLLREDLVHFVASDGHDVTHRPPTLDEAFRYVSKRFGEKRAVTLFSTNPLAALNGEPIPLETGAEPAPSRKWFLPWRSTGTVIRLAALVLVASTVLAAADENGSAAIAGKAILNAGLDPQECYRVRDLVFNKEDIRFYLTDGYLIFGRAVDGQRMSAVFTAEVDGGDGEVIAFPPHRSERLSLASFTGLPKS